MKSIRLLSHLLNAVSIVALGLCILASAGTARADEVVAVTATAFTTCAGCVSPPANTPCAAAPGGSCGFFAACTTCFCVPDPILPWGVACV